MKLSIIILVLLAAVFIACRIFHFSLKTIFKSGGLRFFLWLVLAGALLWLNRYSVMTFAILLHREYPFGEALSRSFSMQNDVFFFIDRMYAVCADAAIVIPGFIKGAVSQIQAGTSDMLTTAGDLVDIIFLVW